MFLEVEGLRAQNMPRIAIPVVRSERIERVLLQIAVTSRYNLLRVPRNDP